jgi:hypothetical protein
VGWRGGACRPGSTWMRRESSGPLVPLTGEGLRATPCFFSLLSMGSLEVSGRSDRWDAPQPSGADWTIVIVFDEVAAHLSHPKIDPTTQVFWLSWRNGCHLFYTIFHIKKYIHQSGGHTHVNGYTAPHEVSFKVQPATSNAGPSNRRSHPQ